MKKAKIVLSAVALMAVVGGAFAFKANRGPLFYFTKTAPTAPCLLVGPATTNAAAPLVNNIYTTLVTTTTSLPATYCTQAARIVQE